MRMLLDGVENIRQAVAVQTELEALWRVPVLGHLPLPQPMRELVDNWHCDYTAIRRFVRRVRRSTGAALGRTSDG